MSLYIATYDICHSGRRSSVARVLKRYGRRLQRSVFEIWLEPEDQADLRRTIGPLLSKTDHFDLVPVDLRRPEHRLRWQHKPNDWDPVLLL